MDYYIFTSIVVSTLIALSLFMKRQLIKTNLKDIHITNSIFYIYITAMIMFIVTLSLVLGHIYVLKANVTNELPLNALLLFSAIFLSLFLIYYLIFRLRIDEIKMKKLAYTDELTNLPNRRYLKEIISQMNKKNHVFIPFLLLDIDRFKTINDTLGHLVGDELIIQVGKRLKYCVQNEGTVARLSGDEFIILLKSYRNKEELNDLVQTIIQTIQKPTFIFEHELNITTSVGISIYPQQGQDFETLWKHSDLAMYHAKSQGGNGYIFYSDKLGVPLARNLMIENDLKKAIAKRQFEIYYQPRIDVISGKLNGAEALIRWKHPKRGFISPSEFIPLAEETGLINQIGEWVIQKACIQIKDWISKGFEPIPISVNLSAKQFQHKDFIQAITKILHQTKIDPKLLELEITERIAMQNTDEIIEKLSELKAIGLKILMDDFGTGYSSLSSLGRLPIDTLKIAREFVQDIEVSENNAIITTIIAMAHSLHLSVIAEGVETVEQIKILKQLNCHEMQGFYFSKPLPAHKMEGILQQEFCPWMDEIQVLK